jgi:RNA polymerase sigma-70 factor (ECF subfamily)
MSDSPPHDASLKELAARLARGEEAAFAELYDACADRLHGYLAARVGSRDAASDVLQSAFLRAVKSRRRFRGVENPIAYMFQIARNEAARATGKRRFVTHSLPAAEPFTESNDSADDAEAVAAALARLDADDRELVELKIYSELTFREIATIVDRPAATVATRYRRAIESLREWLAKQYR